MWRLFFHSQVPVSTTGPVYAHFPRVGSSNLSTMLESAVQANINILGSECRCKPECRAAPIHASLQIRPDNLPCRRSPSPSRLIFQVCRRILATAWKHIAKWNQLGAYLHTTRPTRTFRFVVGLRKSQTPTSLPEPTRTR